MLNRTWLAAAGVACCLTAVPAAWAQRPYIGFAYPAGGQQGTTFQVKLGGQGMDGVDEVLISGTGVKAKVLEYFRPIGPQEMTLLGEQLRDLRRDAKKAPDMMQMDMMMGGGQANKAASTGTNTPTGRLIARIEKRMAEYVQRPASAAIAAIAIVEVSVAPDASLGERELRVATPRGISKMI